MPKGYFLCGCPLNGNEAWDARCEEHNMLPYGWRSPTRIIRLMGRHPVTGERETKTERDWRESMRRQRGLG